jgi:DNA-binding NtrC family response regulator
VAAISSDAALADDLAQFVGGDEAGLDAEMAEVLGRPLHCSSWFQTSRATLELTGGRKAEAARLLDISRRSLYDKIKSYGL